MRLLTTMFALVFLGTVSQQDKCQCVKPEEGETTHYYYAQVTITGKKKIKELRGIVTFGHGGDIEPVPGILVEVFDHPKTLSAKADSETKQPQKRIAACKTGEDGAFCFDGIPPGEYELRCSQIGYGTTSMIVKLDPKYRSEAKNKLEVPIYVH